MYLERLFQLYFSCLQGLRFGFTFRLQKSWRNRFLGHLTLASEVKPPDLGTKISDDIL